MLRDITLGQYYPEDYEYYNTYSICNSLFSNQLFHKYPRILFL